MIDNKNAESNYDDGSTDDDGGYNDSNQSVGDVMKTTTLAIWMPS